MGTNVTSRNYCRGRKLRLYWFDHISSNFLVKQNVGKPLILAVGSGIVFLAEDKIK